MLRTVVTVVVESRFASPVTLTVSASPPTSSDAGTERVAAASTMMPSRTRRLKPCSSNDTSYVPTGRAGIRHSPFVPVVVCCVIPVWTLLTATVTPGRTAPVGSLTVPVSVPVGLPCATIRAGAARALMSATIINAGNQLLTRRITSPPLAAELSGRCSRPFEADTSHP